MVRHVDFTIKTGNRVYYCGPHSPWRRGSNESTIGLLRHYMLTSTDLSKYSGDLETFQRSLNGRSRKTLNYSIPIEKLARLVALIA